MKTTQKQEGGREKSPLSLPAILTLLLLCLCIYSFYVVEQAESPLTYHLRQTSKHPHNAAAHLELTELYTDLGNRAAAEKELVLTRDSARSSDVLGETTLVEKELKQGPEPLRREEAFWRSIVDKHPTYRDGWVQLYVTATNLHKDLKAHEYLGKVNQLDPNFELK